MKRSGHANPGLDSPGVAPGGPFRAYLRYLCAQLFIYELSDNSISGNDI